MADSNEILLKVFRVLKVTGEILLLILYGIYTYLYLIFRFIISPSMKSLDGEIFLITGSSMGIGREVVLQLARHHKRTTLVLWDWNGKENKKTAEDAKALGATVYDYEIDVTDREKVREIAKKVQEEVGNVTILFNNAGIARVGNLFKLSEEDVDKIVQVNLTSHFWTLRAFMPSMIETNHGHIVTTASMGAFLGVRDCVPYFATKYAIRGYLESLQDELYAHPSNPDKIRFTTIFPDFVKTPMTANDRCEKMLKVNNREFLMPKEVAKQIVNGIRENREKVIIPRGHEIVIFLKNVMPSAWFVRIYRHFVKEV